MPARKYSGEEARRILGDVPQEKRFWSHDGCIYSNLRDMANCLGHISDADFTYHANPEKNDYANWVALVVGDDTLARQLKSNPTRPAALRAVSQRIRFLESKLSPPQRVRHPPKGPGKASPPKPRSPRKG